MNFTPLNRAGQGPNPIRTLGDTRTHCTALFTRGCRVKLKTKLNISSSSPKHPQMPVFLDVTEWMNGEQTPNTEKKERDAWACCWLMAMWRICTQNNGHSPVTLDQSTNEKGINGNRLHDSTELENAFSMLPLSHVGCMHIVCVCARLLEHPGERWARARVSNDNN